MMRKARCAPRARAMMPRARARYAPRDAAPERFNAPLMRGAICRDDYCFVHYAERRELRATEIHETKIYEEGDGDDLMQRHVYG